MGRHLGIDFSWILVDFEGQVGAMLGSKIDQNSIQEGIEKRMRKGKRLGGVLEAPGSRFDASAGFLVSVWYLFGIFLVCVW